MIRSFLKRGLQANRTDLGMHGVVMSKDVEEGPSLTSLVLLTLSLLANAINYLAFVCCAEQIG